MIWRWKWEQVQVPLLENLDVRMLSSMSYDEKVLRSEYAFSGLEVLLCDMFRRSRAWVWPEPPSISRGRSVVVAGHLNLYRGRVDQRDLLPQRVSSRECGSAMAACVTQLRFVSNNNESNDLTAPLFPQNQARVSGAAFGNASTRSVAFWDGDIVPSLVSVPQCPPGSTSQGRGTPNILCKWKRALCECRQRGTAHRSRQRM